MQKNAPVNSLNKVILNLKIIVTFWRFKTRICKKGTWRCANRRQQGGVVSQLADLSRACPKNNNRFCVSKLAYQPSRSSKSGDEDVVGQSASSFF